jgi:hypothetical protein
MAVGTSGVTVFDGADAGELPMAFTARTVKLYALPSRRPAYVIEVVVPPTVTCVPLLAETT